MQSGIERRKTARVSLEAPVEVTPYALLLSRLESVSWRGTAVDASVDDRGLSFVTSHPLFTGRKLRIVTCGTAHTAEVRWVGAVAEGYRVGVSLDDDLPEPQRH
jgi:hypothetical protein